MVHSHACMGVNALHFIPVLGQPGTPSNNKLELLPNKTSWVGRIPCGKIASSLTLRALAPLLGTLWFICYKVERVIGSYILIEGIDNVQICMLENNFRMQDAYSLQGNWCVTFCVFWSQFVQKIINQHMNYDISCNRKHTARWHWFTFMNYHSKLSQNSSLVNNHKPQ